MRTKKRKRKRKARGGRVKEGTWKGMKMKGRKGMVDVYRGEKVRKGTL